MGSIKYIFDPKNWRIVLEGISKKDPNETIYKVIVGEYDDVLSTGELCEFMSKEVYDKILDGSYELIKNPYCVQTITVLDKEKNIVPLYRDKIDVIVGKQRSR